MAVNPLARKQELQLHNVRKKGALLVMVKNEIKINSIVRHKIHKNNVCGVVRSIHQNHRGKKGPYALFNGLFITLDAKKILIIQILNSCNSSSDLEITDPENVNDIDLEVLNGKK